MRWCSSAVSWWFLPAPQCYVAAGSFCEAENSQLTEFLKTQFRLNFCSTWGWFEVDSFMHVSSTFFNTILHPGVNFTFRMFIILWSVSEDCRNSLGVEGTEQQGHSSLHIKTTCDLLSVWCCGETAALFYHPACGSAVYAFFCLHPRNCPNPR